MLLHACMQLVHSFAKTQVTGRRCLFELVQLSLADSHTELSLTTPAFFAMGLRQMLRHLHLQWGIWGGFSRSSVARSRSSCRPHQRKKMSILIAGRLCVRASPRSRRALCCSVMACQVLPCHGMVQGTRDQIPTRRIQELCRRPGQSRGAYRGWTGARWQGARKRSQRQQRTSHLLCLMRILSDLAGESRHGMGSSLLSSSGIFGVTFFPRQLRHADSRTTGAVMVIQCIIGMRLRPRFRHTLAPLASTCRTCKLPIAVPAAHLGYHPWHLAAL
mmetsp:Transcript_8334/g.13982  ORF Transcript_8334/g.13982 Transcript_8334/m.13982 type:complete len:274 (+) Transcript_8334:157-978(+)